MATSASSHRIILPDYRQIVLVNACPGDRVDDDLVINPSRTQLIMIQCYDDILSVFDDGGPPYTTVLMELKRDHGSVSTLVPLDGSHHVLDHAMCVKLARYITPWSVRANKDKIDEHSLKIDGNNVDEEEEEICVICLGGMSKVWVELNLCKHRYHEECIDNWLELKRDCPICRAEI